MKLGGVAVEARAAATAAVLGAARKAIGAEAAVAGASVGAGAGGSVGKGAACGERPGMTAARGFGCGFRSMCRGGLTLSCAAATDGPAGASSARAMNRTAIGCGGTTAGFTEA